MVIQQMHNIFISSLILLALLTGASAQCARRTIRPYEVRTATNNIYTVDDEAGMRQIKFNSYSVSGCDPTDGNNVTGIAVKNFTKISQTNAMTNEDCLLRTTNGTKQMVSAQSLILRLNSWTMRPSFIIDDISADVGTSAENNYREAVAVFGLHKDIIVRPSLQLGNSSYLAINKYMIPAASSTAMGLTTGDFTTVGAEFAQPTLSEECDVQEGRPSKCGVQVEFIDHVDTLVVMYALAKKSSVIDNSQVHMGPISYGCECRCRVVDLGGRKITEPIPGVPHECVQRETAAPKTECDVLGSNWCSFETSHSFVISGDLLSSGNYACSMSSGTGAKVIQKFSPSLPF